MSTSTCLRRIPGRQRGIGLLGLLVLGVLIAFAAMIGLKVFPTVTEYMAIRKAVDRVRGEGPNPAAMRAAFDRAAAIDDITSITGKDLEIQPAPNGGYSVGFAYEKRIPLVGPATLLLEYRGGASDGRAAK